MNTCASHRHPHHQTMRASVLSRIHLGADAHWRHGSAACDRWEAVSPLRPTTALKSPHAYCARSGSTVAWTGHPPRGLPAMTDIPLLVNPMPSLYRDRHAAEHSRVTALFIRVGPHADPACGPTRGRFAGSLMMRIWVDADACPTVIKDLLSRAVDRWGRALMLVTNQLLRLPRRPRFRHSRCQPGSTSQLIPWLSTCTRASWS
jgi:hypothetical protein